MKNTELSLEDWAKQKLEEDENAALVFLVKSACEGSIRVKDAVIAGVAIVKAEEGKQCPTKNKPL